MCNELFLDMEGPGVQEGKETCILTWNCLQMFTNVPLVHDYDLILMHIMASISYQEGKCTNSTFILLIA